jgi:hypothetical protein
MRAIALTNFIMQQVMGLKMHGIKFRFTFILLKLLTFKAIVARGGCIVTLYKITALECKSFCQCSFCVTSICLFIYYG